jgi:hypothetical protein
VSCASYKAVSWRWRAQNLGTDYDERVLPSIGNEVVKAVVVRRSCTLPSRSPTHCICVAHIKAYPYRSYTRTLSTEQTVAWRWALAVFENGTSCVAHNDRNGLF